MPKLIILIGITGSGKTTYAKNSPYNRLYNGFVYVNQDEFNGNRQKTLDLFKEALAENKCDIVLDRCNINRSQRSPWINMALQYNYEVEAVYLYVPVSIALERMKKRENHKTIPSDTPVEKMEEIVNSFQKSYQAPEITEGFSKITMLRNY